jgi:hypothetical protein
MKHGSSALVLGQAGNYRALKKTVGGRVVHCRRSPHPGLLPREKEGVSSPSREANASSSNPVAGGLPWQGQPEHEFSLSD